MMLVNIRNVLTTRKFGTLPLVVAIWSMNWLIQAYFLPPPLLPELLLSLYHIQIYIEVIDTPPIRLPTDDHCTLFSPM